MPANVLDSFIEQIARWSRQAVEQGRSPFRRIEPALPLLTAGGLRQAPLVFWINRDSCMAGGLMLFPGAGAPSDLESGLQMADALGIRHFVEWRDRRIDIWRGDEGKVQLECSFSLPDHQPDQVASFRQLLDQTLDQLKYLSVMTAMPPEDLSPCYLANLCRLATEDTRALLEAEQRASQGESARPNPSRARHKGYLTMLRLLALTSLDLLPPSVQPEGLEKALRFAMGDIPEVLGRQLRLEDDPCPLPSQAAVRFHHLLRRLQQLGLPSDPERTRACLELLLRHDAAELVGSELSAPPATNRIQPALSVNETLPPEPDADAIEIGPQPLLAIRTLLRQLAGWDHPELQSEDVFILHLPDHPRQVRGLLHRQQRPDRQQRQHDEAALRLSWPARRFSLPTDCPGWLFEALHLLGICRAGGVAELTLPTDWLSATWGDLFWDLLCEHFTLQELTIREQPAAVLKLCRDEQPETVTLLQGVAPSRCRWQTLRQQNRSQLRFRLSLPRPWLDLLDAGILVDPAGLEGPDACQQALRCFFSRPPGRGLAELAGLRLSEADSPLRDAIIRLGVPVPAAERLERLENLLHTRGGAASDSDLRQRLGADIVDLPQIPQTDAGEPSPENKRTRISPKHYDRLIEETFVDGIPLFPEHYLYDYYRPELRHFGWQGRLEAAQTFFDQVVLKDELGQFITIEGAAGAAGLKLVSRCGRTEVDFPADPEICEAILVRYLQDLQRLRESLTRRVREQLPQLRQSENLIRRAWNEQRLPDWNSVEEVMALFPQQFDLE